MSTNSWKTYKTAVDSFNYFRIFYGFDDILPAPVDHIYIIAQFIAYLSHKCLVASTVSIRIYRAQVMFIKSMTSLIKQKDYEGSIPRDPMQERQQHVTRLIRSLQTICSSLYETCLFSSAFSLAFFAILRASEITVIKQTKADMH